MHEGHPDRRTARWVRHDLDTWEQYAFDTAEKAVNGKRGREWTAVAQSEVEVLREMARCLRELAAGRWPR